MPKTIYLCRHAQAEHNVAEDYTIPDAPLTALGKSQAAALARDPKAAEARVTIELVASSALKRTLQTTLIGWSEAVARLGGRGSIAAMPQLQECNDNPCDTGSPRAKLERDPELAGVDLSLLTPDWTSKRGFYAADSASLNARAAWVRDWLKTRPERTILIVAHGDFLQRLTGIQHAWKNTELQHWSIDEHDTHTGTPLRFVSYTTVDGAYAATSSDPVFAAHARAHAQPTTSTNGTALPSVQAGDFDITKDLHSAAARSVAELEQRVNTKATDLQSQARELEALEARLAHAEQRKQQLEAAGHKV